ncbi:hypothetical protein [Novosphingobium sp.]|uniref:hypothetical protein n=1 Tax=Novosphingobium sp. TaxID=1874826 RepID=UPI00261885FF|nr:hypothetical protein [Novosphingobium sp.]
MALFEIALDEQLEQELNDAAQSQRTDQSGIVRQALAEYLRSGKGHRHDDDAIRDDWQDFSRTVQEAQRRAIIDTIRTLPDRAWTSQRETRHFLTKAIEDADWEEGIEPIYEALRAKVIEKSLAFTTNPEIEATNRSFPFAPVIRFDIGFATDDTYSVRLPLIQAFFQYYWEAGEAAFAEIPAIWEAAKARINAGEGRPSGEEAAAARRTAG